MRQQVAGFKAQMAGAPPQVQQQMQPQFDGMMRNLSGAEVACAKDGGPPAGSVALPAVRSPACQAAEGMRQQLAGHKAQMASRPPPVQQQMQPQLDAMQRTLASAEAACGK